MEEAEGLWVIAWVLAAVCGPLLVAWLVALTMLPELDIDTVPGIVARAIWSMVMLLSGLNLLAGMYGSALLAVVALVVAAAVLSPWWIKLFRRDQPADVQAL